MTAFSHTNLNDVDPNFTPIATNTYSLRVVSAELVPYTDKNTGEEKERVSLGLTIFNDPDFSGRRVWESFFEGDFALKNLRRIMDASGIPQNPGESIESWLNRLVVEQAEVRVPIVLEDDMIKDKTTKELIPNPRTVKLDGSPSQRNRVDWFRIAPVA